jgi:hypothetical protein
MRAIATPATMRDSQRARPTTATARKRIAAIKIEIAGMATGQANSIGGGEVEVSE